MFAALGGQDEPLHSGRRTFATQAARKATPVGGSSRGVQDLLGRASLTTTSATPSRRVRERGSWSCAARSTPKSYLSRGLLV